eukprot:scaffold95606_cov21-Tisochrysis_lutea.AAC.2
MLLKWTLAVAHCTQWEDAGEGGLPAPEPGPLQAQVQSTPLATWQQHSSVHPRCIWGQQQRN